MRKNVLLHCLALIFLVGLSISGPRLYAAPCGTTVNWHNLSDTGCGSGTTDPGITMNVIDQNIDVIGTNALVGGIHVEARTCDITISVTNGDAIITGTGNRCDGVSTAPAMLYLFAALGRTISFNLENNLAFTGTASNGVPLDLLVTASGGGTIQFILHDGKSVSFTALNAGDGGTFFIEGMTTPPTTTVIFENSSFVTTSHHHAQVIVGPRSFMGFASQIGVGSAFASLIFKSSPFRGLRLVIENGGGLNIAGFAADLTLPDFSIGDIDFSMPTNATPNFVVESLFLGDGAKIPGDGANVQIVNNNQQDCQQLLYNPFCQSTPYTGVLSGFVLTAPSTITVNDQSYIEYIGTATNTCCTFTLYDECGVPMTMQRLRNASALIVDSPSIDLPASIILNGSSAFYFVSGVSNCGTVSYDFTVNTSILSDCAGNIVLDVAGPLSIFGSSPDETTVEILSLQVAPTGCPVTVDSTLSDSNFPRRTFARQPDGHYVQYNLGAFLISSQLSFFDTSLDHTDTIHKVYEHFNLGNPNLFSEPTYIGSDSYLFPCHAGEPRPTISFVNSKFRVHNSVASTGVDFLFPNEVDLGNTSSLIFYNNGFCIDKGYGRNMILGTDICFEPCITTTDMDSHLNVFQTSADAGASNLNLWLITGFNTNCITQGIPSQAAIAGQNAVQTIFLNNGSNFSIGTNGSVGIDPTTGTPFVLTVTANVLIDGSYYSFDTRGGVLAFPQSVSTTGQGGIFVDMLGVLSLLNNRIASFGTMVTKSRNGVVNLPSNQAFFEPRVGIAEWQPNLSDPVQRLLVAPGQSLSDYTLDWGAAMKTYCCNDFCVTPYCFIPYTIEEVPAPCAAPAVTQNNLVNLPTVQGEVDQMQILRSRMGDFVHLLVDGGFIRELIFLHGFNTAEGPFGFIVMQNDSLVGLGTSHKDVDSLEASIVLGVNGVMLVPNGNANIELNEDIIINNVCHILSGTAFGLNGPNVLSISSTTPKELRIKSTGVLDLSQFTTPSQIIEFTGQVRLVCEPGARIILNGGIMRFSGQAEWFLEPEFDTQVMALPAVNVNSTDNVRVKLSGTGIIEMIEDSSMFIGQNAFFGVETFPTCTPITNILWVLNNSASIQIGNISNPGGAFQVGDTVVTSPAQSISLQLELSGQGALFEINQNGFFGLGVGIVQKLPNDNPNTWLVGCLSNVTTVSLVVGGPFGITGASPGGTFSHNQIAPGNFPEASLLAIGSTGSYTFAFNPANSVILGGGNMVQINCAPTEVIRLIEKTKRGVINDEERNKLHKELLQLLILNPLTPIQINNLSSNQVQLPVITIDSASLNDLLNCLNDQDLNIEGLNSFVQPTALNPTVTTFAGSTQGGLVQTGILAGKFLLQDRGKPAQPTGVSASALFNYLSTVNYFLNFSPKSNLNSNALNQTNMGFVVNSTIRRDEDPVIRGSSGTNVVTATHSLDIGAVAFKLDPVSLAKVSVREILGSSSF